MAALLLMYAPAKKLSRANATIQQTIAASERIFEILDTHNEVLDRAGATPLRGLSREIEFRDVGFVYEDDHGRPILRGVSLKVRAGETVAIVGRSGAGKTTLVNLLPRFHDVTSGQILVDGVDVRDVTLASLRAQIGIVTQETVLFDDTVANNIAYGTPAAGREAIEAAARAAHAHEFIRAMPRGYETMIGERGQRLSGGQRQRIAIARAMLKDSPILVLDEATSSLDSESEHLVQEALANLMANRTAIVIAHRLSTIRRASVIVVLERGRVVEMGRHDELLARAGGRVREAVRTANRGRQAGGGHPGESTTVMIRSMTGFASVSREDEAATVGVTVRAVNHRYLDVQLRVPPSVAPVESRLRAALQRLVARGRVELSVSVQTRQPAAPEVELNVEFVRRLGGALERAREQGLVAGMLAPGDLLRLPQALVIRDRPAEEAGAADGIGRSVEAAVEDAVRALNEMRVHEGEHLHADLEARRQALAALIEKLAAAADEGRAGLEARLSERVRELIREVPVDQAAVAQEIVRVAARSDISEEVVRFRAHLAHWATLTGAEEPCGRKLDFLLQEMNREINTIGSKADGLGVSELIVTAKAELEKMREQVQNVE